MNPTEKSVKEMPIKKSKLQKLQKKHYPLQYILGNVNFYGYQIFVNKHVLIPRFETEGLIEQTLSYLKEYHLNNPEILDIGTGSGCIAITLAKKLNTKNIDAIDVSRKALDLAHKNAFYNQVKINFYKKDLKTFQPNKKYDLIISNPPYLTHHDDIDQSIKYEPKKALFAKDNGLEFYKIIIKKYKKYLKRKSILAFEIGESQADVLVSFAQEYFSKSLIKVHKDLSNRNRYLFIINE